MRQETLRRGSFPGREVGEQAKGFGSIFKNPDGIALFAFACGTMFLHGHNQLRFLALLMIAAFVAVHGLHPRETIRWFLKAPPELWCYTAWVLWAGVTGWVVADNQAYFLKGYKVLFQMLVMVWVVYGVLKDGQGVEGVFLAILLGGGIQIFYVLSGHSPAISNRVGTRLMGMTSNPNSLGIRMVWGVLAALLLWNGFRRGKALWRFMIFGFIPLAVYVMLLSGSRKSSVAMVFLVVAWIFFVAFPVKGKGGFVKKLFWGSLVLGMLVKGGPLILNLPVVKYSPVVQRFQTFFQKGGGSVEASAEANVRYWMYVEGIKMFLEHPVFGVGLNNFAARFYTGQYSHSDYIEPLATTGLIGFFLYQAFYIFLLARGVRLLRVVRSPLTAYSLKVMILGVLSIMLIGFGAPHYTNQSVFILLVAFSVYTWVVENLVRKEEGRGVGFRKNR